MAGNVVEFSDATFEADVLKSDVPVLVDFWAPWCGPCKMLAPTIQELAGDYQGKVRVGKLDTDQNPKTATAYRISAIPTVLLFKGGDIVEKFVGVAPKSKMSEKINAHLGG